jgi:apolipoprotein N-acyltransferase
LGNGPERPVFATDDRRVRAVPAICYESVFGDHIADHARRGANLLVVITNDGWWGTSPGYRQHLALGRLRAIETRRPIARAANTGISCFVDAEGRIGQSTGWWQRTALRGTVHPSDEQTFFLQHGDLLGRACAFCGLLVLRSLLPLVRRMRVRG